MDMQSVTQMTSCFTAEEMCKNDAHHNNLQADNEVEMKGFYTLLLTEEDGHSCAAESFSD